jgi:hypothetical protein
LVYPQFDITIHVKDLPVDKGLPLHLVEDFGFASGHADVVGFWQFVGDKKYLIDEVWIEGKTDEQIIVLVEKKLAELGFVSWDIYDTMLRYKSSGETLREAEMRSKFNGVVSSWACPPEEPSKIQIRQDKGYSVVTQTDNEIRKISYGIPIVRRDLEQQLLFIDPKCKGTVQEMLTYSNKVMADGTIKDEPNKAYDNGPDMIRYMYINHFPNINIVSLSKANRKDDRGSTITGGIRDTVF